jgi:hypothetical protein
MILVPRKTFLDVIQPERTELTALQLSLDLTFFQEEYDKIMVSFNGNDYVPFVEGMKIPDKYHELSLFSLRLRFVQRSGAFTECSAEPQVVTRYIGLGENYVYPKVIQSLLERVSTLEKEFSRLLNDTKSLRDVVRDIYEEGDIV